MFDRFKNNRDDGDGNGNGGGVATRERDNQHEGRLAAGAAAGGRVGSRVAAHEMRKRQRAEFGGINWGAAFFGYLVVVGMAAILLGILAAAGAAIGLTNGVTASDATNHAGTVTLVGGILLLAV